MSDLLFLLPDLGEGLIEATVLTWHVRPGDQVAVNQVVAEVETAKAVVELPCPYAGTVAVLHAAEGQTVDVGVPLLAVTPVDAPAKPDGTDPAGSDAAESVPPPLVGYGAAQPGDGLGAHTGNGLAATGLRRAPGPDSGTGPLPATPPARRLARDLGIDLAQVTGTGPQSAITREDIRRAATAAHQPAPPAAEGPRGDAELAFGHQRAQRVPVTGVRRQTALATTRSAFTAPHATAWVEVDATGAAQATASLRELPEFDGVKVTPLLLAARALVVAAGRHPLINASWDEPAQEIVVHPGVNLGVAVATPRGLIVPNIKDAGRLTLPELARTLHEQTLSARQARTTPADLAGGTITITNVGALGMDGGTPILVPGEAAILALGRFRDRAQVVDGQLAIRTVTTLALSFDHRLVDGDLAAAVLRDVGAMLADPLRLLVWC